MESCRSGMNRKGQGSRSHLHRACPPANNGCTNGLARWWYSVIVQYELQFVRCWLREVIILSDLAANKGAGVKLAEYDGAEVGFGPSAGWPRQLSSSDSGRTR